MQLTLKVPINFYPTPASPEVGTGKEAIRLAVRRVSVGAGEVEFDITAAFEVPESVGSRYRRVRDAMVLVVSDVESADAGVLQVHNDFIEYAAKPTDGPNQIEEPALPMPGRGSLESEGFEGGWASMTVAFRCASTIPRYRPSVYVYLVLENYVSNVIGLDLVDKKAIDFPEAR